MPTPSTSEEVPDWTQELWRNLECGERIEEGDWTDANPHAFKGQTQWVRATDIGSGAPDPNLPAHRLYRRVIPSHRRPAVATVLRERTKAQMRPLLQKMLSGAFSPWVMGGDCKITEAHFEPPHRLHFTLAVPAHWDKDRRRLPVARLEGAIRFWDMEHTPGRPS